MRPIASLVKCALLGFSALAGGAHALLKADPDVKTVPAVPNESESMASDRFDPTRPPHHMGLIPTNMH